MGDDCHATPCSRLPPFRWPLGASLGVLGIDFAERVAVGLLKMGRVLYRRWWIPLLGALAPMPGVVCTPCHHVFGTLQVFSVSRPGLPTGDTVWGPIPRPHRCNVSATFGRPQWTPFEDGFILGYTWAQEKRSYVWEFRDC